MPNFFPDFAKDIITHIAWEERRRRVRSQVSSTTPENAAALSEYAAYFPTQSPGVLRSLAQSNLSPDHPVARFAITQDMVRNHYQTGSYNGQVGTTNRGTRPRQPTPHPPNPWQEIVDMAMDAPYVRARERAEAIGFLPADQLDIPDELRARIRPEFIQDGFLSQPDVTDPELGTAWRQLISLADAYGANLPYVDGPNFHMRRDGRPYNVTNELFPTPPPDGTTGAGNLHVGTGNISNPFADSSGTAQRAFQGIGLPYDPNNPTAFLAPLIQPTFAALDAPVQEAQGQVRNVYSALHGENPDWLESQSDLGVMISRTLNNQDASMGNGYFVDPDSAVARERRAREAERGQIGGHNVTLGRIVANQVTEPDTKPFQVISGLVDGAVQVADPSAFGLGKLDAITVARRTFSPAPAAGTFRTFRNVVHGPTISHWLTKQTDLVNTLAKTDSPYEIAKLTNFKLDPTLTADLAATPLPREVRNIIGDAVRSQRITQTTDLRPMWPQRTQTSFRSAYQALNPRASRRPLRIFQTMPSDVWDLEDHAQIARNAVRTLNNVHAPESDIAAAYNHIATARTRNSLRKAVLDIQGDVGNMLSHYGIKDPNVISRLTRTNASTYNEHGRGLINEIGEDVPTWEHMTSGGQMIQVTGPHLPLEHIGRYIHTPNVREVRRLTTRYPFLTARNTRDFVPGIKSIRKRLNIESVTPDGQLRLPLALLDGMMSNVLKPAWLLRLAWPIRVVGEEQLRMSAAGLTSAFSGHPISYLSLVIGSKENRLQRLINAATPGIKPSHTLTPAGELVDATEELAQVTYRAHASWLDTPGTISTNARTVYTRTNPHELEDFTRSWADELALLSHDPISRQVLNADDIEDVVDWLYSGKGNQFRQQLMDAHPGNLSTRPQVRTYLDTIVDRVGRLTNGDTDIIDAIRTGSFTNAKGVSQRVMQLTPEPATNGQFTKWLTPKIDAAPEKVKGLVHARSSLLSTFGTRYNAAVDGMMHALMGAPTSTLSRSPAFRQFLWRRAAELLPWTNVPARATILANARAANLPRRTMRSLERASRRNLGAGKLTLTEANDLAKANAIEDTKSLLYDLSQKSQAADVLRLIAPFGEAWREVLSRWGNLAFIRGPGGIPLPGKPIRRAQQIIQGLRGEELGDFFGNEEGQGFFFENEFGEEVFAYPGSEWLTNAATGVPVPLHGRVQGLNMFGSILPGLGPVAQIPAALILQDRPDLEWWREQIMPFGAPGIEDTEDIFHMESYMPAWAKTGYQALIHNFQDHSDDRIYANNMMQVASYLYSTGEYGNTPEEQQRLISDARDKSKDLYFVRAFGQFLLPSSPSFQWLVEGQNGENISARALSEEFYTLSDDYNESVQMFLDMYGEDAIGAVIPKSRSVIFGAPTSLEAAKWVHDNPHTKSDYPLTYGFFAPTGDFHNATYLQSFTSGERETLTPHEWNMLRDSLLGNYHYQRALDMLGDRADNPAKNQREWLAAQRKNIESAYPLWGHYEGLAERPTVDHMVEELYRSLDDPVLRRTDTGRALTAYLKYRDQAQDQAEAAGYVSFDKADALAPTREWLAGHAARLMSEYPAFRQVWNLVLSRELSVVEEEQAGAAVSD